MRTRSAIAGKVAACARLCIATDPGRAARTSTSAASIASLSDPMLTRWATGTSRNGVRYSGSQS